MRELLRLQRQTMGQQDASWLTARRIPGVLTLARGTQAAPALKKKPSRMTLAGGFTGVALKS